jgi:CDP-diacylglycerol--glycerol-3-phosphate 3-phosphatidyltransferase/cardiolipin synthase
LPLNLPIVLTWLRVVAIPLLVALYYLPEAWMTLWERNLLATVLFTGAAITDWLDGWLARRWNQVSSFGAFLDPVADKLIVAAALIVLVELSRVNAVIAFIIIGREITISALREWMAKVGETRSVAVNMLGKIKTVAQLVAIPMLLYHDPIGPLQPQRVGTWLIWVAALLTVVSMVYYLKLAAPRAFNPR